MCYNGYMENKTKALSYSALNKFLECPEMFHRTRTLGMGPSWEYTPFSARGQIMHAWLEKLVNVRIMNGDWPSTTYAEELMTEYWTEFFPLPEDKQVNLLDVAGWTADFHDKSFNDAMDLIPQFYDKVAPLIHPLEAEAYRTIDLPVPGKEYKRLHGYIDVVAEPNILIDWKTSKSAKNPKWLDTDLQATVYAALSGWDKLDMHFIQFIFLKTKKPRIEIATTKRDIRHVDWLLNEMIPAVIAQLESGVHLPRVGWHCDRCPAPCGAKPDLMVERK